MSRCEQVSREAFRAELRAFIAARLRAQGRVAAPGALSVLVDRALAKGRARGLARRDALAVYVGFACLAGLDFDLDPAVAEALGEDRSMADARMVTMVDRLDPEDRARLDARLLGEDAPDAGGPAALPWWLAP
ncbi:hypothetical protein SAMN05444370_104383 [Rubrimonas cliftonensis]|uniref:Uncharacterized protein n=2 Tax=Rubrimonas cliftonensis TaxID=89524 RepID=A0A1H4AV70_9RHOB|nr:hypothetical protein SAMN05444370_104383 [Rubrimonas cliftonensis]